MKIQISPSNLDSIKVANFHLFNKIFAEYICRTNQGSSVSLGFLLLKAIEQYKFSLITLPNGTLIFEMSDKMYTFLQLKYSNDSFEIILNSMWHL